DRALSLSGLTVTTPRRVLGCYGGPVGGLEVCVILDSSRLIELGVLNGRLRRRDILVPDRGWLVRLTLLSDLLIGRVGRLDDIAVPHRRWLVRLQRVCVLSALALGQRRLSADCLFLGNACRLR